MYSRGDGETSHQCIVVPTQSNGQKSKKLHATNLSGGWVYEVVEDDLDRALALVTVVELGESLYVYAVQCLSSIAATITIVVFSSVYEPGLNCLIFAFLHQITGMLTPAKTLGQLDELLRDIPLILSPEDVDTSEFERFSCRVWIRQAIRYLARNGFIICEEAKAAHDEIVRYALENDAAVATGAGKFTFHTSSYCT